MQTNNAAHSENQGSSLRIGWASADITPDQPILLMGQMYARVSEGVADPITATAMAIESAQSAGSADSTKPSESADDAPSESSNGTQPRGDYSHSKHGPLRSVLVSCDLIFISADLREAVRKRVARDLPEMDPRHVVLNATHSHTAPKLAMQRTDDGERIEPRIGIDLDVMPTGQYIEFAADRIAQAVSRAWHQRQVAGIGFGLGQATIGYNRLICDYQGPTRMYGGIDRPEFSHIEGGIDTSVNVMCTWNREEQLTGLVVNLACPSQVSEHLYQISSDFWCEARTALREQFGEDIAILAQVSAAGELVPARSRQTVPDFKALERMWAYHGRSQRQEVARRITDAVGPVVRGIAREIDWQPDSAHQVLDLCLPKRHLTEQDVQQAQINVQEARQAYEALRDELQANPQMRQSPRWYGPITRAYRKLGWNDRIARRFEAQTREPEMSTEVHILRLGEMAFATNQFELYLDFGRQIKGRSHAVQTFLVQLAGPGSYLPTQRAIEGNGFGSRATTSTIGPEGGRQLVDATVHAINELYQ